MILRIYLVGCLVVALCHTSEAGFLVQVEIHLSENEGFMNPEMFSVKLPKNTEDVRKIAKFLASKSVDRKKRKTNDQKDMTRVCTELRSVVCKNLPVFQAHTDMYPVTKTSEKFTIVDEDGNTLGIVKTPIYECVIVLHQRPKENDVQNEVPHLYFSLYIAGTSRKLRLESNWMRNQYDDYQTEFFYLFMRANEIVKSSDNPSEQKSLNIFKELSKTSEYPLAGKLKELSKTSKYPSEEKSKETSEYPPAEKSKELSKMAEYPPAGKSKETSEYPPAKKSKNSSKRSKYPLVGKLKELLSKTSKYPSEEKSKETSEYPPVENSEELSGKVKDEYPKFVLVESVAFPLYKTEPSEMADEAGKTHTDCTSKMLYSGGEHVISFYGKGR